MIIQNNMAAMGSSRQTGKAKGRLSKKAEQLASGYRINHAADDSAGLAISEKMRGQIRGLKQASENAQDGISLLQTADSALNETHSLIQRIRELSVQAANDTNTEEDRENIQTEIDLLLEEADRIAEDTEFNTIHLLDGSLKENTTTNPNVQLSTAEITNFLENIVSNPVIDGSVNKIDSTTSGNLSDTLCKSIVPQAVNAFLSTFPAFSSAAAAGKISNQIGLNIYQDTSNTLASVTIQYGYDAANKVTDNIQLKLSVNVNTLQFTNTGELTSDSRRALETTIVHEMMHAFMDDTLTNGMIGATNGTLDAGNKFPSWFKEGMSQTAAGGCSNDNDWINGGLGLTKNSNAAAIKAAVQASSNKIGSNSTSSEYGTGYLACMYLGYLAAGSPSSLSSSSLAGGINTILSKLMGGASLNDVIKDISNGTYTSISDFEAKFGDDPSVAFISQLLNAVGDDGNGSVISSLTASDLLPDADATSSVYKADDKNVFVTSSVGSKRDWGTGGAVSGTNSGGGTTGGTGGGGGTPGTGGGGGGTGGTTPTFAGAFYLQIGANTGQSMTISIDDMHTAAIGLTGISVSDHDKAGLAIEACDKAIQTVSKARAKIGAYTNRLEYAVSNLDNTAENLQAAESRIRDADMADLMVEYAKENILMQAGQSMLAQANQSTQGILQLLQ